MSRPSKEAASAALRKASPPTSSVRKAAVPKVPTKRKAGKPAEAAMIELFGQRLKAARAAAGLTQAELAKRAGILQTKLPAMEAGRTDLKLSMLRRLARAIGVSLYNIVPEWHQDVAASKLRHEPDGEAVPDDLQAVFGHNFRLARLAAGLSQSQAAKLSGVNQGSISLAEAGRLNATIQTMAALAPIVGKTVNELLTPLSRPGRKK